MDIGFTLSSEEQQSAGSRVSHTCKGRPARTILPVELAVRGMNSAPLKNRRGAVHV